MNSPDKFLQATLIACLECGYPEGVLLLSLADSMAGARADYCLAVRHFIRLPLLISLPLLVMEDICSPSMLDILFSVTSLKNAGRL